MKKPPADLIAMTLLMFTGVMAAWTGVGGAIVSDATAQGAYNFIKDWQTLFGALVALGAALFALRPVWGQLGELRRQSQQRAYELLSARNVNLHREQQALFKLTSSIDIMLSALLRFPDSNPVAGIGALAVANIEGPENYLRETIQEFKNELGPVWGTATVQSARKEMLDEALRFANEVSVFTSRVVIGNRISVAEISPVLEALKKRMKSAFAAAEIVHQGINVEQARISSMISDLENRLLA